MKSVRLKLAQGIVDVLLRIEKRTRLCGSCCSELELSDLQDESDDLDDLFPEPEFDLWTDAGRT